MLTHLRAPRIAHVACLCGLVLACGGDAAVDSDDIAAVDSGDIATVDSDDIATVDSRDIATVDSGDIATLDSGDISTLDSDDIAALDSDDIAAVDSDDTATVDTDDITAVDTAPTCDPAACTGTVCAPASCLGGECRAQPLDAGAACDDGNPCTDDDACDGHGACTGVERVCDAPPAVDVAAACALGPTVDVYLGAGCGGACDPASGECAYTATTFACPPDGGLAHTHGWQVALRAGLGELTRADVDVALAPTAFDAASLEDADTTFRLWVAAHRNWYTLPPSSGVRMAPEVFLLDRIEGADGVHGGQSTAEVNGLLFWYRWDWEGNPYHGQRAVLARAFAMAAVDLIMIDTVHFDGSLYAQQHFLSGTMNWLSGALLDVHRAAASPSPAPVSACTEAAFRLGLQTMFERLEAWDVNNGNNDMAQPGHLALYEAAAAMPDPSWMARALAESQEIFERSGYWHDAAGYFDHGAALDSTYEGISMHMLSAAALGIPEWPHLSRAVAKYQRLKAHLILPEPDGHTFVAPSHWNPATAGGVADDQWWSLHREVGLAMVSDEAMYLVGGGRGYNVDAAPPDLDTMRGQVLAVMPGLDATLTTPIADAPGATWVPLHWSTGRMAAVLNYQPGFYQRWAALAGTDLARPPMLRAGGFVESWGDDFIIARLPDFAAIIYAGPLNELWATPLAGLGGGTLSAFWTPGGGAFVLGSTHGTQNPHPDLWEEIALWPMQHLWGTTDAGAHFTTARVLVPERSVTTTTDAATVDVSGTIAGAAWSTETALDAAPTYERHFAIDASGVSVSTTLESGATTPVCELVDAVPLFLFDALQAAPPTVVVRLVLADGARVEATTDWVEAVAVEVERYDRAIVLTLDHARRVRLSAEVWQNAFQSYQNERTLHIDAREAEGCAPLPAATTVGWHIGVLR